jgi:hypothetical protein
MPIDLKRNVRVGPFAVLDLSLTIVFAFLFVLLRYEYSHEKYLSSVMIVLLCLIIAGSAIHYSLDIPSGLNHLLGLSDKPL